MKFLQTFIPSAYIDNVQFVYSVILSNRLISSKTKTNLIICGLKIFKNLEVLTLSKGNSEIYLHITNGHSII